MRKVNGETPGAHCPLPDRTGPCIQIAHGGGGRLMNNLLDEVIRPGFGDALLDSRHDGATFAPEEFRAGSGRIALTTDSYVVKPRFFPGGDIGRMAVFGTVNDLAMCGARPLHLTAAFILEEGLPLEELRIIAESMGHAAREAGVRIATGDTKVVERGHGDGIYINTAGLGVVEHDLVIGPASIRPGDAILLSGDMGRHGAAILAAREGLSFESDIESDCAPLAPAVRELLEAGIEVHCLRDLTRGGLSAGMVELAECAELYFHLRMDDIQVREDVRGACEFLGLDPLHLANEGRFALFLPSGESERALEILGAHPGGEFAREVGRVFEPDAEHRAGLVLLENEIGTARIMDMLDGEQLPRIC